MVHKSTQALLHNTFHFKSKLPSSYIPGKTIMQTKVMKAPSTIPTNLSQKQQMTNHIVTTIDHLLAKCQCISSVAMGFLYNADSMTMTAVFPSKNTCVY